MNSLMMSTGWFSIWALSNSIEQELEGYSKEKVFKDKLLETYIESVLECGYQISMQALNNIFGAKLDAEEIDKTTLFYRIKNTDQWIN